MGKAQEISFRLAVYDKLNHEPVRNATVKLQDINSLREYKMNANDFGLADIKLKPSSRYRLEVIVKDDSSEMHYLGYSYMLSEQEVISKKIFEVEVEKVKHADAGLLPAMHFEYNNPTLSEDNVTTLDNVLKMLKSFGSLQIEIGIYSDCRENSMLVSKRANAIIDYLAGKQQTKRAFVKEYGNIRALNQCDCSNSHFICSEEKYSENRRAEFKVIAF